MTNGIVSLTKNGKTFIKVIAGCDGMRAPALAAALRELKDPTVESVRAIASKMHFGCFDCLVVMSANDTFFHDDLDPLYLKTFDDPRFNPRWHYGTAPYVEVVEIGDTDELQTTLSPS